jgi:hypothetical protein
MKLQSIIVLLMLCSVATAQDWELTLPSTNPLRYGYATGTYSAPTIRENGITKKWVNENLRHKFIKEQVGGGPTWGALDRNGPGDPRGSVRNVLANVVGFGGGMAYTQSELKGSWAYIPVRVTILRPDIFLEWEIENKCSSPPGQPVISAHGHGAVSGSISQSVRRIGGVDGQKYYFLVRTRLKANLERREGSMAYPSVSGYMSFRAGQSYIIAKYSPNLGGDKGHGWRVTRHTRRSSGTFYDKTYEYPGYKLDPGYWMGCYVETTGKRPITYSAQVGKAGYPQTKKGVWEEITADRDTTAMKSSSYPEGTTGADPIRDDKWSGSIQVKPGVEIRHP